jgi:hypothetical protein
VQGGSGAALSCVPLGIVSLNMFNEVLIEIILDLLS